MEDTEKKDVNFDEITYREISDPTVMANEPLVSVRMSTYNHEPYIAQAIEGVLMQETDFPIELVIGEDYSTDGTREIIFDYQKKHPDIVRVITSDHNVGMHKNGERVKKACRGKYIAFCEGDDYWTDPRKLQKQVDFLEKNPDCSLCFHAYKRVHEQNLDEYSIERPEEIPADNKFEMKHVILGGGGFMATCSLMCLCKHRLERPEWMVKAPVGDLPVMLLLATKGRMGYIDEVMSAYRSMVPNSWSSRIKNRQKRKEHHYKTLKMFDDFDKWTNREYHSFVVRKKIKNRWMYIESELKQWIKQFLEVESI